MTKDETFIEMRLPHARTNTRSHVHTNAHTQLCFSWCGCSAKMLKMQKLTLPPLPDQRCGGCGSGSVSGGRCGCPAAAQGDGRGRRCRGGEGDGGRGSGNRAWGSKTGRPSVKKSHTEGWRSVLLLLLLLMVWCISQCLPSPLAPGLLDRSVPAHG